MSVKLGFLTSHFNSCTHAECNLSLNLHQDHTTQISIHALTGSATSNFVTLFVVAIISIRALKLERSWLGILNAQPIH